MRTIGSHHGLCPWKWYLAQASPWILSLLPSHSESLLFSAIPSHRVWTDTSETRSQNKQSLPWYYFSKAFGDNKRSNWYTRELQQLRPGTFTNFSHHLRCASVACQLQVVLARDHWVFLDGCHFSSSCSYINSCLLPEFLPLKSLYLLSYQYPNLYASSISMVFSYSYWYPNPDSSPRQKWERAFWKQVGDCTSH